MKKTDDKGMHDGHRERLLNLAVNAGFAAMSDYQIVEFFLTFIFPRGDVNPLAHRLLNEFEDFSNILDASPLDTIRIHGINDRSSKRISVFKKFIDHYNDSRLSKRTVLKTYGEIIDLIEEHVRFRDSENLLIIGLSPSNRVIQKRMLSDQSSRNVSLTITDLTTFFLSSKAAKIAIGHCHPYGEATPSAEDEKAFKEISSFCELYGVEFLDSYIVGTDGVYSQLNNIKVRTFRDVDEVASMLIANIEKGNVESLKD